MRTEVQEFTVRDRLGELTVQGRILADCRWERSRKPRWTDMALYEVVDQGGPLRPVGVVEEKLAKELDQEIDRNEQLRELSPEQRGALNGIMSHLLAPEVTPRPQYVLEYIARSYVYHRFGSPCVKKHHSISTVGILREVTGKHRWRYLYPCRTCRPEDLEDMNPNEKIAEEQDAYEIYACNSAADVVSRLYRRDGTVSGLAADLLKQASQMDQRLASAWNRRRRV